jgi:hypothetical protein
MSYLILYAPICLVILVVLCALEEDKPYVILKKAIYKFAVYTAMLTGISAIIWFINKYL